MTKTTGLFTLALLCDPGCEDVAALEVKELLGKKAEAGTGYVTVAGCTAEESAKLLYRSQTASRLLALVSEGRIAGPDDILKDKKGILDSDYAPFIPDGGSFRVTCDRLGSQEWQSHEVEEALGAMLHEEKGWKVDLGKPALTLFCQVVDDRYVLGADLAGRDLGKREYKAFHTRKSLRATVAYAAARVAGFAGGEALVDPFTTDGEIPIEASLFATGTSPHRFKREFAFTRMPFAAEKDWEAFFTAEDGKAAAKTRVTGFSPMVRTLQMARANAKLAGVDKTLRLTKCEVTWLDTKFEEESVDRIVTLPPASGRNTPLKEVEKVQDDLFYQARYAIKAGGKVLLVSEKKAEFLNAAERHGFKLAAEREVRMGGTTLSFLTFGKGKK